MCLVSVIGIPLGIRFLVRYQFLAQVVVTENRRGADAPTRSAQLVRGRWWHTAVMVGVFNPLVAGAALTVGLLLLVLFGDAVAEHAGQNGHDNHRSDATPTDVAPVSSLPVAGPPGRR